MKNETVFESFVSNLCTNCKNRNKDLCNITRDINRNLRCAYYEKAQKPEGYKEKVKRRFREWFWKYYRFCLR